MPVGVQVAVDIPGGRVPGQDDGGYETSEHYSEYYGHPDHVLTSSPADPLPTGRRSPSLAKVRKVQASYIRIRHGSCRNRAEERPIPIHPLGAP